MYGISSCPNSYPKGDPYGFLCTFLNQVKYHENDTNEGSKLHFQNKYCKKCWNGSMEDEIYLRLSQEIRECIPDLTECSIESSAEKNVLSKIAACQSYQMPLQYGFWIGPYWPVKKNVTSRIRPGVVLSTGGPLIGRKNGSIF